MIKAKVQLFDDASGKDIGEQKIVSPVGCTFYGYLSLSVFRGKNQTSL